MDYILTLPKHGWRAEHSFVIAQVPNLISIVIPTLGRKSLKKTLASVEARIGNPQFEVIVCVDSKAELSGFRHISSVRLVASPGSGVNRARNSGARNSQGGIIWFLDDDIELFHDGAYETLQSIFKDTSIVACGGEYVSDHKSSLTEVGYNALCSVWRSSAGSENREYLLGGTLAVRRSAFEEVGGFDENIEYGGAETSFVQRLHANAAQAERVVFDQRLDVLHRPADRSPSKWAEVAAAQSLQKKKESTAPSRLKPRLARSIEVVKRQDLRSRIGLILFGVPFIAVSRFVALTRR